MVEKNKNTALLVLGAIAVVAVVGLVMMFVNDNNATGEIVGYGAYPKLYGGAIYGEQFPNYINRGSPYTVTPDNQGVYVGKTQETGYLGTVPPKTYFWEGQGPKSPAQTAGFQWGGASSGIFTSLTVHQMEQLNGLYVTRREGNNIIREKAYDCGKMEGRDAGYYCIAKASSSLDF